jgi:hypothetical protein
MLQQVWETNLKGKEWLHRQLRLTNNMSALEETLDKLSSEEG